MTRKMYSSGKRWKRKELQIVTNPDLSVQDKLDALPERSYDAIYWQMNKYGIKRKKAILSKEIITEKVSFIEKKSTRLRINGVSINIIANIKDITVDETGILIIT